MGAVKHVPVMLDEVLEFIDAFKGGKFLDCTLGGAGHAEAILGASEENQLWGFDCDPQAVRSAAKRLEGFGRRVICRQGHFSDLAELLAGQRFNGILADLGLSTVQLKSGRGFSFNDSSSLDMRMDPSGGLSAAELVNRSGTAELTRILRVGGVGRDAARVAAALAAARPIESAAELAQAAGLALRGRPIKAKRHPEAVVMQAIRIAVNDELNEISALMDAASGLLQPGGRLVVISFHSLEDRIVARAMRSWSRGDTRPALWPKDGGVSEVQAQKLGRLLSRKAVRPGRAEIERNAASRSARLRAFERG